LARRRNRHRLKSTGRLCRTRWHDFVDLVHTQPDAIESIVAVSVSNRRTLTKIQNSVLVGIDEDSNACYTRFIVGVAEHIVGTVCIARAIAILVLELEADQRPGLLRVPFLKPALGVIRTTLETHFDVEVEIGRGGIGASKFCDRHEHGIIVGAASRGYFA
jgi:hypothetical protein